MRDGEICIKSLSLSQCIPGDFDFILISFGMSVKQSWHLIVWPYLLVTYKCTSWWEREGEGEKAHNDIVNSTVFAFSIIKINRCAYVSARVFVRYERLLLLLLRLCCCPKLIFNSLFLFVIYFFVPFFYIQIQRIRGAYGVEINEVEEGGVEKMNFHKWLSSEVSHATFLPRPFIFVACKYTLNARKRWEKITESKMITD